jgi:hypothetical protein
MKKILIILFFLLSVFLYSQEEIYYNSNPTLEWDYDYLDSDGNPLLPEDTVNFELYLWDQNNGLITEQVIESLNPLSVTTELNYTLSFPYRSTWAVALRAVVIDGDGNTSESAFAYTTVQEDVSLNPFVYAPILIYVPLPPRNLRDSGM